MMSHSRCVSLEGQARAVDRLWQIAYWVGFRLARVWWFFRRPEHRGSVVAAWFDGQILLVQHSYRLGLGFPGGGIRNGEDPRRAAQRELAEELGLEIAVHDLTFVYETCAIRDYRHDHVQVFETRLNRLPRLQSDMREIVSAEFVSLDALQDRKLSPIVSDYLTFSATGGSPDRRWA